MIARNNARNYQRNVYDNDLFGSFEERISMLVEENKKLRISPDHSGGIIQRLERKNTTLQSELERVASK